MVEGPGVHRVAVTHRRILQGRVFQATSPNGQFADGAAGVNGHVLSHIEAHGKHIFYFFTPKKLEEEGLLEKLGPDTVVVHVHFGMAGTFRTFPYPGPEPRQSTRLRLENKEEEFVAHLSAALCMHGNLEIYRHSIAELGPDPLRQDADKEVVWSSMQAYTPLPSESSGYTECRLKELKPKDLVLQLCAAWLSFTPKPVPSDTCCLFQLEVLLRVMKFRVLPILCFGQHQICLLKHPTCAQMQKTKRAIGAFLMDQSKIAGIGNIYRSELLLVAGIHPDHPACTVSRTSFQSLWIQAKRLMEIGVKTGYIITILTDDAGNPLPTVRGGIQSGSFVYNQKECGACGAIVFMWKMSQRTVFACQACQPPPTTVTRRKLASIPSTRLGGRDYTLEIEELTIEKNLNTTVKSSKKTDAKGGQVVEHQAFNHISTGGLSDAFEIPGLSAGAKETKDSQDHALAEITAQISTIAITSKSHRTSYKLRTIQGEDTSDDQVEEEGTLESNLVMSEITSESQKGG